jgi:hypothetical protein
MDPARLLSRFDNYQEFSQWFIRMGGNPPPADEVSQYFNIVEAVPVSVLVPKQKEASAEEIQKPAVSMKNTKVQLIEIAASNDVIVSYYDNKKTILQKMKRSGKFTILFSKSKK